MLCLALAPISLALRTGPTLHRRDVLSLAPAAAAAGIAVPALADVPSIVKLADGSSFPLVSFGLQIYNDDTAEKLTTIALEEGYRNFFASVLAGNQRGFARAVKKSKIPREELYICGSVVSNRVRGEEAAYASTARGCAANLEAFAEGGIDYVDMIMLDYPGPDCDSIRGQWKAFEKMKADGQAKSLAVSNFSPAQLDCILNTKPKTKPVVNQLPISVGLYGRTSTAEQLAENKKRGVLVQAWSPLGGSTGGIPKSVRQECATIGKAYGKSGAQVALRWIVQSGAALTTQTKTRAHFKEDLDIFDFALTADEMERLNGSGGAA